MAPESPTWFNGLSVRNKQATRIIPPRIGAAALAFKAQIKALNPAEVFVAVGLLFGLAFVVVTPLMQVPDEVEHFYRSYQLSTLDLVADPVKPSGYGGQIPTSVISVATQLKGQIPGHMDAKVSLKLMAELNNLPLNPSRKHDIRFENTSIYSPVAYIPQTTAMGIGRLLHFHPVWMVYFGRLLNLFTFLALVYAAIRVTPVAKWFFAAVALNPMALSQAASLSSDAMSVGICLLYAATILHLRQRQAPAGRSWMVLLAVLAVSVCLLKVAYIPLVLLVLLVPARVVSRKAIFAMLAGALILGLAWNMRVLPIAKLIPAQFGLSPDIRSSGQVKFIIGHPLHFAKVLANNVAGTPSTAVGPSYFGLFGWADTWIPFWTQLVIAGTLLLAVLYRDEPPEVIKALNFRFRAAFALVLATCSAALYTALDTGYTPVGAGIIDGIQGRYFIPLTPLLAPVLASAKIKLAAERKHFATLMIILWALIMLTTLVAISRRFY